MTSLQIKKFTERHFRLAHNFFLVHKLKKKAVQTPMLKCKHQIKQLHSPTSWHKLKTNILRPLLCCICRKMTILHIQDGDDDDDGNNTHADCDQICICCQNPYHGRNHINHDKMTPNHLMHYGITNNEQKCTQSIMSKPAREAVCHVNFTDTKRDKDEIHYFHHDIRDSNKCVQLFAPIFNLIPWKLKIVQSIY